LAEATSIRWRDVDFTKNTLTVTGGDAGTKNHEQRTIPMSEALRTLLMRLKIERQPKLEDFVSLFDTAKKTLQTGCRRLGYPQFTHHDFRHFFATTCIESGVDVPTVSRWLGHRDGGALAMRVYGHLRQEHSLAAIKKVLF
jgi:integrase